MATVRHFTFPYLLRHNAGMNSAKKVMIVDDDEAIGDAVQLLLEEEGYEVLVVRKAKTVMDTTMGFCPSVIVVDYLLEDGDGVEIIRQLKSTDGVSHIPVVLFSAHPDGENQARACGAQAFLPKPFEVDQLLQLIEELN